MHINYILNTYFYVDELRDCCAEADMKVSGNKAALIDRLCSLKLNPEYFLEPLDASQFDELADVIEEEHRVQSSSVW